MDKINGALSVNIEPDQHMPVQWHGQPPPARRDDDNPPNEKADIDYMVTPTDTDDRHFRARGMLRTIGCSINLV